MNSSSSAGAKFAFDIYDFEGKSRMDLFYLGDCLRGLNLNPTLKMIDKLGGTKKKGEAFLKLDEVASELTQLNRIENQLELEKNTWINLTQITIIYVLK